MEGARHVARARRQQRQHQYAPRPCAIVPLGATAVCASSAASHARFAVEYVTTIVGALILYLLSSLGTFEFATTDASASDAERLLLLVAVNVLPEVLIDSGCLLIETEAGLGPMHLRYWRTLSPLTVLVKTAMCLFVTAFVLAACLVAPP